MYVYVCVCRIVFGNFKVINISNVIEVRLEEIMGEIFFLDLYVCEF